MKRSKRYQKAVQNLDLDKRYSIAEAVQMLKNSAPVKFDQSIDVAIKLNVDPKKADQQVRGTVPLPHGVGKKISLVVIAKGDKLEKAKAAGADFVGAEDLIEKIQGGWTDFDALVTTPDMMREVGKLGKVLGPRGLMPTPKAGTVTTDIENAVKEIKAGKIEFKVDKSAVINNMVGKISFEEKQIEDNVLALLQAVQRAKPSTAKGQYITNFVVSSTMGPGIKIDLQGLSLVG